MKFSADLQVADLQVAVTGQTHGLALLGLLCCYAWHSYIEITWRIHNLEMDTSSLIAADICQGMTGLYH